jgi:hypothetical protein
VDVRQAVQRDVLHGDAVSPQRAEAPRGVRVVDDGLVLVEHHVGAPRAGRGVGRRAVDVGREPQRLAERARREARVAVRRRLRLLRARVPPREAVRRGAQQRAERVVRDPRELAQPAERRDPDRRVDPRARGEPRGEHRADRDSRHDDARAAQRRDHHRLQRGRFQIAARQLSDRVGHPVAVAVIRHPRHDDRVPARARRTAAGCS